MCLIIYAKENRPKPEYIENGASGNPDGIGIAWREGEYLRYKKGLTVEETKELAATLPIGYVIHFRLASVGGKTDKLIHPFPVRLDVPLKQAGKANKLLFHNGHWGDWENVLLNHLSYRVLLPDGLWSDTRALAMLVAFHGKSFLSLLSSYNRFILMTPNKTTVLGDFEKESGVYYSNNGYKWGGNCRSTYYHSYHGRQAYDY